MRPATVRPPTPLAHLSDWLRNSLRNKGMFGLVDFAVSLLFDYWFDIRYGTDTMGWVQKTDLALKSKNRRHSSKYQATKFRPFMKFMAEVHFPPDSVFVDVGCGKGRVLLMASRYQFAKIIGIEFDPCLAEIARTNINRYRAITNRKIAVEVVCGDILDYQIKGDENVWFLYNPFDEVVLRRFLRKLQESLLKHPRKIWLIYHVPRHQRTVKLEMFPHSDVHLVGGSEFRVYQS